MREVYYNFVEVVIYFTRPSLGRMIPRSSNSSSASSSNEYTVLQQSAPVNILDWFDGDGVANYGGGSDEDGEENDESDSKLPPHEFIARRLERSQISSFSVLEGAGRTLKGRDLSKVRNVVLPKIGFLETL
ncbi:hypothetical protein JHK82_027523 [Glycine max]|uniref:Uncharacterized protein n=1 Tax=Glycine max TaxID=3847 RepID=A0A0R0HRH9_SOYBN|nr:hypothetical protein JHK87_027414 [Glycine soja]KAG5003510.1 hypothetical protein JHK86_027649 [Glycine max]KAG5126688.1 hypothetical protein JHK82_027523 [Glycine max]KAG5151303.1 hypothetical protein JHK84_027775 [Glycine max]